LIEDLEKKIKIQLKEKVVKVSKGKDAIISDTDEEIDLKMEMENQAIAQAVKKNNRVIIK